MTTLQIVLILYYAFSFIVISELHSDYRAKLMCLLICWLEFPIVLGKLIKLSLDFHVIAIDFIEDMMKDDNSNNKSNK